MVKYKFTLSIGYPTAKRSEIIELDDDMSEEEIEEGMSAVSQTKKTVGTETASKHDGRPERRSNMSETENHEESKETKADEEKEKDALDEYKQKIDENLSDLKKNQYKLFMFLLMINNDNTDKHVNEFCAKFNISNHEHKNNIKRYYELFIQMKTLIE